MRYRFGEHTLDTDRVQLLAGGVEVALEPQAFAVLEHLVRHRERVVPKTELLDQIWGTRFVSESTLTTRIKQVRRAVGDDGAAQQVIRTSHGRGYRFVAPVEEQDAATRPATRYAEGDGASIAYQTFGDGPDLVLVSGYATNVEVQWEHPAMAAFLTGLGRFARVTVLDKRGVGLSDRLPHDSVPSLETRADDLTAVLDAAGIERAALLGSSEGGSLSAVYAAAHPERVDRLLLHDTWVTGPEFPLAGPTDLDFVLRRWGTGAVYARVAPSIDAGEGGRASLARYERQSATPRTARHLLELIGRIDIAGILSAIAVPTLVLHRASDPIVPLAHGRRLAAGIPGAQLVELDGADHYLLSGESGPTLAAIEAFLATPREDPDGRVLATVLFVESAGPAAMEAVERQRGRTVRIDGQGLLATFDRPSRAVLAAAAVHRTSPHPVRAGVHTAEIHADGTGPGVDIAIAVASLAASGTTWVTRTVTDLVAGTGLSFESRGEHALPGGDRMVLSALT